MGTKAQRAGEAAAGGSRKRRQIMKGRNKKGKKVLDKVTPREFFTIERKVFGELWGEYRGETAAIMLLVMLAAGGQLVEPKFLEYITNTVSGWLEGRGAFGDTVAVAVSFFADPVVFSVPVLSFGFDHGKV